MKKFICILLLTGWVYNTYSQGALVWDPFVMSQLVLQHTAQQEKLKDIKQNESKILAAQAYISEKMRKIKEIEEKFHKNLKKVSSIIRDGADILYAKDIVKDIGKYQKEMVEYAHASPTLLVIAYQTEKALIDRTADLLIYIFDMAIVEGDLNLIDPKQRHDIITHVIDELRAMRGLAYGVARRMKFASKALKFQNLTMEDVQWPDNDKQILEGILNDLKK